MISVRDNSSETPSSIPAQVQSFFRAGGTLESAAASESFVYEIRPQQIAMADAVAQAVLAPGHLAVEAGTGVGKTFAYLAPLILLARERDMPVAISTQTINLQEQIVFQDIPFLKRHLGVDFDVALCKGRQNYLCLRRLGRARQMSGDLFHKTQERELDRILRWADKTEDGSLSDWPTGGGAGEQAPQKTDVRDQRSDVGDHGSEIGNPQPAINNQQFAGPSPEVWGQVCSEHDNCLGRKCPHGGHCFLMRARRQAFEADLLVLNHHLFFADLALRREGAGLLPDFKTVVLDEAHCLEDTASEHLGLRLSQAGVEHWLRRLYVPESGKGLLAALKESELAHSVSGLWDDLESFFLEIKRWANLEGKETRRVVGAPLEIPLLLGERLALAISQIERRGKTLEDPDIKSELQSIVRRGREIRDSLAVFLQQSEENHVYWIEREGVRRKQFVLYSAPIEVGPILETILFGQFQSVILTSATLAVAGGPKGDEGGGWKVGGGSGTGQQAPIGKRKKRQEEAPAAANDCSSSLDASDTAGCKNKSQLAYFRKRVGAVNCRELVVGSPFDYSRQMRVYIAGDMPDPSKVAEYTEASVNAVAYFVRKSRGRAFVLFTSAEMMKAVVRGLEPFFEAEGIMPLVQGTGLSRHVMLDRFRRANDKAESRDQQDTQGCAAVLFGLASFWMGVDVCGEALSNVIIARLPFAVPDEPVTKARMDRIAGQGGDPFRDYSLPEAILRFRQGVGRLIRTATDEGMIAILDPRVVSKWYGRHFLGAIPECPVEIVSALEGRQDMPADDIVE
jgi:ATP-dependent DNA helicase DinG